MKGYGGMKSSPSKLCKNIKHLHGSQEKNAEYNIEIGLMKQRG